MEELFCMMFYTGYAAHMALSPELLLVNGHSVGVQRILFGRLMTTRLEQAALSFFACINLRMIRGDLWTASEGRRLRRWLWSKLSFIGSVLELILLVAQRRPSWRRGGQFYGVLLTKPSTGG